MSQPEKQTNQLSSQQLCSINQKDYLPKDSVSRIKLSPSNGMMFACTSWDGHIRLYEFSKSKDNHDMAMIYSQEFPTPLTAFSWYGNDFCLLVGSLEGNIYTLDPSDNVIKNFIQHDFPILEIFYVPEGGFAISLDCHQTVKFSNFEKGILDSITLEYEIMCAEFQFPWCVIGLAGCRFVILDVAKVKRGPVKYLTSNISSSIHSLSLNSTKSMLVFGSIDGRIGLQPMNKSTTDSELICGIPMVFKAHRTTPPGKNPNPKDIYLYPINAISMFYKNNDCFCISGCSNGNVIIWNLTKKHKCKELNLNRPVTAICWSSAHNMAVISTGYDWCKGASGLRDVNYSPEIICYFYTPNDFENSQN